MAMICKQCGGLIPDWGNHSCTAGHYVWPYVPQPRIVSGQKCDICGSTAIDHTEAQCSFNRSFLSPTSQVPTTDKIKEPKIH